jgi:hypothetical protein
VVHSEVSESGADTRFVQAWVRPDESGLRPSYDEAAGVAEGAMVQLVGGPGLTINTKGAGFFVSSLDLGERVALPEAEHLHVFVASGGALLGDHALGADDSARLVDQGGRVATGEADGTRLLVWAFD